MKFIFTCKQASHALSRADYEKLPFLQKVSLKFHVLICPVCGAYNRQVMKFQDMTRTLRKREEEFLESDDPQAPHLSETSRDRLKESLERARKSEHSHI